MTIHMLVQGVDLASCKIAVYWNLNKCVWSIKLDQPAGEYKSGKVVAWADADHPFALTGVTFHVNVRQHRNALAGVGARGTKRNVVAWVCGKLADAEQVITGDRVTFHWPDTRSVFHRVDTDEPIHHADAAVFVTAGVKGNVYI